MLGIVLFASAIRNLRKGFGGGMKFARVIGTLVATRKYEGLEGVKFLVVQLLDEDLNPQGRPTIAADATAQAGPGELVFVVGSREAAQALPEVFVPVDLAITGIVDEVEVERGPRRQQPTAVWHHLSEDD
jgi:ethanolamine utilization protein EutN